MKKMLASDSSLKIISFIIAIVIWVGVAIIVNPEIEVKYTNIPIQFEGQDELAERGYAVIAESMTSTTVIVKGDRTQSLDFDEEEIIVKADVAPARLGPGVSIKLTVSAAFMNKEIKTADEHVEINVEPLVEKKLQIETSTVGKLDEHYMSGDVEVNPKEITVKGPASAIERVAKAAIKVDVSNASVDIDKELPVTFFDKNNKEITAIDTSFKRINISNETISVHCPVFKVHEFTPVVVFDEPLPEGFEYKIEPSPLYVYGADVGKKISKIETLPVSLSKLQENDKVKARLVIPENVKILYDIAEVEVSVEK